MTAIHEALDRAGFDRKKFELRAILKNFLLAGGTYEDIIAILDELRSEGHHGLVQQDRVGNALAPPPMPREDLRTSVATSDHSLRVDVRHPITSEGQRSYVQKDHAAPAFTGEPLPSTDHVSGVQDQAYAVGAGEPVPGEGQSSNVGDDHARPADTRTPLTGEAAMPDAPAKASDLLPPAREPSAEDLEAMHEAADISYFQMIKLRTKAWAHYRFKDLKGVRATNLRENIVVNEVIEYGREKQIKDDKFIHLNVPVPVMKDIMRRANNAIRTKDDVVHHRRQPKKVRRYG